MAGVLQAWWDGELVGRLTQDRGGDLGFAYDADWVRRPEAQALSASLPKREQRYRRRACRPFFAGLLPDEGQREGGGARAGRFPRQRLRPARAVGRRRGRRPAAPFAGGSTRVADRTRKARTARRRRTGPGPHHASHQTAAGGRDELEAVPRGSAVQAARRAGGGRGGASRAGTADHAHSQAAAGTVSRRDGKRGLLHAAGGVGRARCRGRGNAERRRTDVPPGRAV